MRPTAGTRRKKQPPKLGTRRSPQPPKRTMPPKMSGKRQRRVRPLRGKKPRKAQPRLGTKPKKARPRFGIKPKAVPPNFGIRRSKAPRIRTTPLSRKPKNCCRNSFSPLPPLPRAGAFPNRKKAACPPKKESPLFRARMSLTWYRRVGHPHPRDRERCRRFRSIFHPETPRRFRLPDDDHAPPGYLREQRRARGT